MYRVHAKGIIPTLIDTGIDRYMNMFEYFTHATLTHLGEMCRVSVRGLG